MIKNLTADFIFKHLLLRSLILEAEDLKLKMAFESPLKWAEGRAAAAYF